MSMVERERRNINKNQSANSSNNIIDDDDKTDTDEEEDDSTLMDMMHEVLATSPNTKTKVPINSLKKLFLKFLIAGPVQKVLRTTFSFSVRR